MEHRDNIRGSCQKLYGCGRDDHNTTKTESKPKRGLVYDCTVYVRFNRDLPLDILYVRFIVIDDIVVFPFPLLHFPTLLSYS